MGKLAIACSGLILALVAACGGSNDAVPEPTINNFALADTKKAPVPSGEALRALVTDSILDLDRAIRLEDFTRFHNNLARVVKISTTPSQVKEVFKELIDSEASLSLVSDFEPSFDSPPALADNGTLRVAGYYPAPTVRLEFLLSYVYEQPDWKLVDMSVDFRAGDGVARSTLTPVSTVTPTNEPPSATKPPSTTTPVPTLTAPDEPQFELILLSSWGLSENSGGKLNRPQAVDFAPDGSVYVINTNSGKVQLFTDNGNFISEFGSRGEGPVQFKGPQDIAVDASGNVYVSDSANNRVQKISKNGRLIVEWGREGVEDGQFKSPSGIAIDPAGFIYVVDKGNQRIQKFTESGQFVLTWGTEGEAPGQFQGPSGIATGPTGEVYVADTSNRRLQKFSESGTFITSWGGGSEGYRLMVI